MRLLLINPNTTQDLTDRLAASAARVLPSDVELLSVTASTGFPYISSRAEAQIAAVTILEVLAEQIHGIDAAIIAAFGDPGLHAARELFDLPVTGMSEAAMIMSLSLGERFAFVTFSPRLGPWYAEQVARAGLSARFAGVFTPEEMFGSITSVAGDLRSPLIRACLRAAREADVVILAGAPIAGLAAEISSEVPAVLIDPIQAAVLQAVALWRLAPKGADSGCFARPSGKESTGLPKALASWIARRP
ncbi:MAG: aspartate/glutamate racemase family protein [Desulfomicrobium sp.]|uniref:aspartate/glutamate racemase family protein n=1 Tax=Hoeflea sp. TaxID=1940281 RepID=UPI0025C21A4C|nr:aspartate/glutamate racemase family protein [Hoeflea sp.]MBU4527148.1 aspartate/glutamate racemase family protein [Alphaproteobacteria bacterium]MBV1713918.1 aspartate/glutamate racemase family protein [Desulfomicrobium sp.]MBU4544130.1 aspartate/glutamate racemase family protein [Alphaproteobacteria bacterium]MBU4552330.1 aspartate/glutamate racemase family protein [Alphaproteobacteria bacterium]MBV1786209.1 aspartate/glutamate racemase family protein [Hoeflea sp.]